MQSKAKIELYLMQKVGQYNSYKLSETYHEDFSGVSTFNAAGEGWFRVEKIDKVAFNYSGDLTVYAQPLPRDKILPEPVDDEISI